MDARAGTRDEVGPAALEGRVRPSRTVVLPGVQETFLGLVRGRSCDLAEVLS
ncbi:hypothetical protein AB0D34_09795 [Streptomyces sp. NPDC048420]|uniref:hypothetical protein n=1 Tax=Streptomyces sp. NPDC048420 TaxID=3155755 RepID=UPI0034422773